MTNGNDTAFPIFNDKGDCDSHTVGLSKREYFAAKAMQSLLVNTTIFDGSVEGSCSEENYYFIAMDAVKIADVLIKALNSTPCSEQ